MSIAVLSTANNMTDSTMTSTAGRVNPRFTENKGQICDQNHNVRKDVLYSGTDGKMVFHIKPDGISYQLHRIEKWESTEDLKTGDIYERPSQESIYRVDLQWIGVNSDYSVLSGSRNSGYENYYLEHCPNGVVMVQTFESVTLKNIYNGIDLKYYEKDGNLKCDYIVGPNRDHTQIKIRITGGQVNINEHGALIIETPFGKIEEGPLVAYQEGKQLSARWKINGNVVSFEISGHDKSRPFVIDPPTRIWGTYYGGQHEDYGYSCATDNAGNVYMAGYTGSVGGTIIATQGAHQSSFGAGTYPFDAYLVKFTPGGQRIWATYYGGERDDYGMACATDSIGNVYLAGYTGSATPTVIATPGSHQPVFQGGANFDAFVAKFDSSGVRQWGTYYGGTGNDVCFSCATDPSGNIYLAGHTGSNNGTAIADLHAHQSNFAGGYDAFLVKFSPSGIRLWGTYYGGGWQDMGYSCATDLNGSVYLAGTTGTSGGTIIATPGSHQNLIGSFGTDDAFLVKFDAGGIRLWGTYYGGGSNDYGYSCTTDKYGNVFLAGRATSGNGTTIATPGSHQSSGGGGWEAYLAKFNSNGSRLWGTYYGGPNYEAANSIATDNSGNIYLTGWANPVPGTIIASAGSYQTISGGLNDCFLAKFDSSGVRIWGTFYGGTESDEGLGCTVDQSGNVYVCGFSHSGNGYTIASQGSHQENFAGWGLQRDGFLVKFNDCIGVPQQPQAINGPSVICINNDIITYFTPAAMGATGYSWTLPAGWTYTVYANFIQISATSSGIFSVVATNPCGTSPAQIRFIEADFCAGMTDQDTEFEGLDLYPNPCSDKLYFRDLPLKSDPIVEVRNALGQVVLKSNLKDQFSFLDLQEFEDGIYFVILNVPGHGMSAFKIIKEN